MITKKLFTPKCQHVDRDMVFREDLNAFFTDFLNWLNHESFSRIEKDYGNKCDNIDKMKNYQDLKIIEKSTNENNEYILDNFKNKKFPKDKKGENLKKNNFSQFFDEFIHYKNDDLNDSSKELFSLEGSIFEENKIENEKICENNYIIQNKYLDINKRNFSEKTYLSQDILLNNLCYSQFKIIWKEKNMSMLHFCKSKEENSKEYYEVLFGEIQSFLIENNLKRKSDYSGYYLTIQIASIYSLYSIYFTQTTDFFYQINTIPEYLKKINQLIKNLQMKGHEKLTKEILLMVFRLHKANAFSIGILPGLKTIILNKYGLPCEQKSNTYNDYMDINNNYRNLHIKDDDSSINNLIHQYKNIKFNCVSGIKDLINDDDFNNHIYCDFINTKNRMVESSKNDLAFLRLDEKELAKNINNLDLQFNIFDNFI